jgi:hypothetical protein
MVRDEAIPSSMTDDRWCHDGDRATQTAQAFVAEIPFAGSSLLILYDRFVPDLG